MSAIIIDVWYTTIFISIERCQIAKFEYQSLRFIEATKNQNTHHLAPTELRYKRSNEAMPFVVFANCETEFGANFHLANISGEQNFAESFFFSNCVGTADIVVSVWSLCNNCIIGYDGKNGRRSSSRAPLPFEISQKIFARMKWFDETALMFYGWRELGIWIKPFAIHLFAVCPVRKSHNSHRSTSNHIINLCHTKWISVRSLEKIEATQLQALPEIRVKKVHIVVVAIGRCPIHLMRPNCTLKCKFNIWPGWLRHVFGVRVAWTAKHNVWTRCRCGHFGNNRRMHKMTIMASDNIYVWLFCL